MCQTAPPAESCGREGVNRLVSEEKNALIIGAGRGGMSTAIGLKRAGMPVKVFERELGDMSIVQTSSECVGYSQDEQGVTARFADGREERGVALIGADGVRSAVRQQLVGDGPPRYSGHVAWRGMFKYKHPTLP